MPYNFIPLGGTQVQTDLRTIGAFSGTSTNIISTGNAPYPNGRALNVHSAGTATSANPGSVNDYFCFQISTKTSGQLYAQGGWGCYWRAMSWIGNSVANNLTWDGTDFWMQTTSSVSGNWIGQSPDGKSWNFVQMLGAQSTSITPGPGVALGGVFGYADVSGSTTVFRYRSGASMGSTLLLSSNSGVRAAASSATRAVLSGGAGRIWATSDVAGPWTSYLVGSGTWTGVTNIPGTSTWVFCGSGGSIARSTDDLATAPVASTSGSTSFNSIASSSTSVIVCGGSGSTAVAYRSTTAGASWVTLTFPAAMGNIGSVAYGNGCYVVASYSNSNIAVSVDDGLSWTTITSPFPTLSSYVNDIAAGAYDGLRFANGRFWLCASGSAGNSTQNYYLLASSVNGLTWELHISAPLGVAAGTATPSCQGIFAAENVAGVPTNANTSVGVGLNAFPPVTQSHYPSWVVNNSVVATGAPSLTVGVNQWHEFQIFGRPAATANEWAITFIMDGVAYGPYTTNSFAAKSTMPLWFMIGRGNFFTVTSDVVFYDFPMAQDPGTLGPDMRIYYDQPVTDYSTEWNPSIEGQTNAAMVATTSVTNATTYVTESDAPKTDIYNMAPTNVPASHSILGTKNTAYFGKLIDVPAVVSVGSQVSGLDFDSTAAQINSPIGSWTYLSQTQLVNPVTGNPWTRSDLNQERLRITRNAPSSNGDPNWFNVTSLLQFDGTNGQSTSVDSSSYHYPVTLVNSVLSSSQVKFGSTSLQCASGTGYATIPYDAATAIVNAAFTIEGWFYSTSVGTAQILWQSAGSATLSGANYIELQVINDGTLRLTQHTTNAIVCSSAAALSSNQWYHIAVVRQDLSVSNLCQLYVNGALWGSGALPYQVNSAQPVWVGNGAFAPTFGWRGFIDDFRITRGVARYTTSFTPPTAAFPDHY